MKKLIYSLMAMLLVLNVQATDPPKKQKIYSIIKQRHTIEWYQEQISLWKTETEVSPKNAAAWMNLYAATRNIKLMGGGKTQNDLDKIVEGCEKSVPNSFEYNHIKYWNGTLEEKDGLSPYLQKAYEINPNRPETYPALFTYYYLQRDKHNISDISRRWFASNDMSSGIYAWCYNMLMSCEENAILITVGDNDTYPTLILQNEKKVRQDITVINLYLIAIKDFQEKYFQEIGIPIMEKGEKDFESVNDYHDAICAHIRENSNRPFYYTQSHWWNSNEKVKEKMYITGLTYKYSKERFDNIAALRKNYENHFLKDYLAIDLQNDISQTIVDRNSGSYLMPLLTLFSHYKEAGQVSELEEIEKLINKIADKTGQIENVNSVMNPSANSVVSEVITDPRDAYWGFMKIDDTLHASQCEISYWMYDKFLLDLLKQQRYADLEKAKHEKVDWKSLLLPQYKDLDFEEYFEHGKPGDDWFPISNVSYEGAMLYCEWLTNIYNNLYHKKKEFKRVLFRLPTEKEWEYLARKGRNDGRSFEYPWGNIVDVSKGVETIRKDTIVNGSNCYLANIKTNIEYKHADDDPKRCQPHDGGIFPVKATSYHPNDAGLYCMIGNVAEMTSVRGIAKGGGWNTLPQDATISSQQKYEGPDPNVGFRVVMIVVEK